MADDFSDKSKAFKSWFLSHPAASMSSSIDLADYRSAGRGRGVVALEDIPADTELFTIDPSSVLSVQTSSLLPMLDQETREDLASKPWPGLILALIYEFFQGERSTWAPYLQLLPGEDEFDTLMYWSGDELNELQASAIRSKIGKFSAEEMFKSDVLPVIASYPFVFQNKTGRQHLEKQLAREQEPEQQSLDEQISEENLLRLAHRMASTIMAYAFDVERNDKTAEADQDGFVSDEEEGLQQKAMMPTADMLNADVNFNAGLFQDDNCLKMRSTRDIKRDEEVLNDFGAHPRAELLRRYGYVTDRYFKYDVVEISLDLVKSVLKKHFDGKTVNERLQILQQNDEMQEDAFIVDRGDPQDMQDDDDALPPVSIPNELVELVHSMLADAGIWRKYRRKLSEEGQAALYKRALPILQDVVRARLSEYCTSANEDVKLLASNSLGKRISMAVTVRLGEKQLLEECLVQLNAKIDDLNDRSFEPATKRQKRG